jgi:enamine deaminase RidA (YjgF/YER057c/UK114 family)
MKIKHLTLLAAALMASTTASAQTTKRIPLTASQNPSGADLPFSQAVWAGDTLYVSGWLDPDIATHPDTRAQTIGILQDVQKFLKTQNLTLGDVVMIREFIGPGKDGKFDRLGVRAGLVQFFGTKDQPNKPASTGIYVGLPAGERGALVELDVIAARPVSTPDHKPGG